MTKGGGNSVKETESIRVPWKAIGKVALWIFIALGMFVVGMAALAGVAMLVSWLLPMLVTIVTNAAWAVGCGVAVWMPAVLF